MDARRPCPDSALLAAFLDGTLADYERTAVVSHLAECQECRAVALTVIEFREVEALDTLWDRTAEPAPPPPLFERGAIRWTREKTRAPALALATAAAIAALAVPIYFIYPLGSAQQAVSTLIEVAEGQRPVEARVSGVAAYAPPPSETNRGAMDDRARLQLITTASNIRDAYEHDYGAPSRRAVGVAALLTGDLDEAIATLEIAASASPDDATIANDLAAAYYERAQRANRPDDLPAALSAVERVLYRDPAHLEALFNRALIITALGLRVEAAAAWRAYIARDSNTPWTTEARQRLEALAPTSATPAWADLKKVLDASNQSRDAELAVRHHASAARDYVETELLKRWVEASSASDARAADAALARMHTLAEAFQRISADRLYQDFLASVRLARANRRDAQTVAAHEAYLKGLALMAGQRFSEAAPALQRARAQLLAVGSPFSGRATIELAATDYYASRYREAAAALVEIKGWAQRHQYAILVTRAAWLHGMALFSSSAFASAQIAYEEMLTSAVAAGDVDAWVTADVLLANLHEMIGDTAEAWRYRTHAASKLDQVFSQSPRAIALASASGDALGGEHHAAALLFQSALLTGSKVSANLEVQVRSQRARSFHALARPAEAHAELTIAEKRLADVPDAQSRLRVEVDVLTAQAEVLQDRDNARAIAAAERALLLPFLQLDEVRRARVHLQLSKAILRTGALDRAEQSVRAGIEALETFKARPTAEFAIRASDAVWGLYSQAAQIALKRGDLNRAFAYSERGRVRTAQERRTWGATTVTLDELRRVLPREAAVMVMTQFEGYLQLWLVRGHNVVSHSVPLTRARAASLVSSHLYEMTNGAMQPTASGELFDAVFRPMVAGLAGVTNLVVVADAPYNRIAFAGLWDRQQGRYVVENHGVVIASSATSYAWALDRSTKRAPTAGLRQASFIDAPTATTLSRDNVLAAALQRVYGPDRVRRADGATASRFTAEVAARDVVHIAARVHSNDDFPDLSRVVLADEPGQKYSGAAFARSVSDTTLRAQLVATESGGAPTMNSLADGPVGFARALIAAGVPVVVSPVTDIAEASVEQTWLDFHRHYAAGNAAAESLRRAQLEALSESNRRPGPWATLTVFGSTQ